MDVPKLPESTPIRPLPDLPEIPVSKREAFIQHVRYAMFRKQPLDSIFHPGPD